MQTSSLGLLLTYGMVIRRRFTAICKVWNNFLLYSLQNISILEFAFAALTDNK